MSKKFLFYWGPVIVWCTLIFYISSYKTASTSDVYWEDFTIKKFAHVIFYGILGALNYRALLGYKFKNQKAVVWAIILSGFYGATDEIHQRFTGGRTSRLLDVIFDTIGASLVTISLWKLLPKTPKRLKKWLLNSDLL